MWAAPKMTEISKIAKENNLTDNEDYYFLLDSIQLAASNEPTIMLDENLVLSYSQYDYHNLHILQ